MSDTLLLSKNNFEVLLYSPAEFTTLWMENVMDRALSKVEKGYQLYHFLKNSGERKRKQFKSLVTFVQSVHKLAPYGSRL